MITQPRFWFLVSITLIFLLWLFKPILSPFAAGVVIAYLLDPLADWLESKNVSRTVASLLIIVPFSTMVLIGLLLLIPIILEQLLSLAEHLPTLIEAARKVTETYGSQLLALLPDWLSPASQTSSSSSNQILGSAAQIVTQLIASLVSQGIAIVNLIALIIITPIVAFYFLIDWDRMVAQIESYIPKHHSKTVHQIVGDINGVVAGFIRGQFIICSIIAAFYAISLSIIGLNFALLIGVISGIIGFIPYVGSIVGFLLAFGVALYQFWPDWIMILVVVSIFGVGQFIEGNILQPYIIGNRVGLHPVWLIFALFAFGYLFGFVGLLIAIPASAAIAVLVRFALGAYRNSHYYQP